MQNMESFYCKLIKQKRTEDLLKLNLLHNNQTKKSYPLSKKMYGFYLRKITQSSREQLSNLEDTLFWGPWIG